MSAEAGRLRGEADLAAGRRPEDWSEEERKAAEDQAFAFWWAYQQARQADDPPRAPAPLWFTLPASGVGVALREVYDRTPAPLWVRMAAFVVSAIPLHNVSKRLGERRARGDGFARRREIPEAEYSGWLAIPNLAWGFAKRADLRRRGAWPPTWQTTLGTTLGAVIVSEVRWRRAVAAARHRVST